MLKSNHRYVYFQTMSSKCSAKNQGGRGILEHSSLTGFYMHETKPQLAIFHTLTFASLKKDNVAKFFDFS